MVAGERRSRTFDTRRGRPGLGRRPPQPPAQGPAGRPGRPERETLAACLRRWLEGRRAEGLREKSWRNHERNVALHIAPRLGAVRLPELTVAHLRGLFAALQPPVGNLGPRSVRHVHTTLRQALDQAVDDGLVPRNVARSAQLKAPRLPRRGRPGTLRHGGAAGVPAAPRTATGWPPCGVRRAHRGAGRASCGPCSGATSTARPAP